MACSQLEHSFLLHFSALVINGKGNALCCHVGNPAEYPCPQYKSVAAGPFER